MSKQSWLVVMSMLLFGCATKTIVMQSSETESVVKNPVAKSPIKSSATKAVTSEGVLDTMDSISGWESYTDKGAFVKLASVSGKKGKALELSYDMGAGAWLAVCKRINKDISKFKGIRFTYRGTGDTNTLEFKLEDADGTNYGIVFDSKSNISSWTTMEVLFSDMEYFWGGDQSHNLDMTNIKLHFALSKRQGDTGGSGKVIIDQLELMN